MAGVGRVTMESESFDGIVMMHMSHGSCCVVFHYVG